MPGLEQAIEPRPEIRKAQGGGPQGKMHQMGSGGPEGAEGAGRSGMAITVPIRTAEGEKFALVPTMTPDGQPIEPEEAVAAVQAGELEPLGVFSSMEEAEQAKSQLDSARPEAPTMAQGLDEAMVRKKGAGMPPGM